VLIPTRSLKYYAHHPHLTSFPTRRSSDLQFQHRQLPRRDGGECRRGRRRNPTYLHRRREDLGHDLRNLGCRRRRGRYLEPCRRRSEEHTSELQSPYDLVCRLLLEKKKSI